jgi:hypothetical protein
MKKRHNFEEWVGENSPPPGYYEFDKKNNGDLHPYVMRKEIDVSQEDAEIFFMGDIHGGAQSLLRVLWQLVISGYLDDEFEIVSKKKFYMVFLGDYVDRGNYGAETLYILCKLKLANWDNVFLLRGNHEDDDISSVHGFKAELTRKFGKNDGPWNLMNCWYGFLPMALFLNGIHISHGGIGYGDNTGSTATPYDAKRFLNITNNKIKYEKISVVNSKEQGFNWTDYVMGNMIIPSPRKVGYAVGYQYLQNYMTENNLFFSIRGHQHNQSVVQLINSEEKAVNFLETAEIVEKNENSSSFYIDDLKTKLITMANLSSTSIMNPVYNSPHEGFLIIRLKANNKTLANVFQNHVGEGYTRENMYTTSLYCNQTLLFPQSVFEKEKVTGNIISEVLQNIAQKNISIRKKNENVEQSQEEM